MKNKESFLKELQSRLSVLEEAEQQDILAEYAQHIDLRVASGLSEEAAIQDFGDIGQLAAEILSAYHVKATYQASKEKKRIPSPWPAIRRGAASVGAFFRRIGGSITEGFRKLLKAAAAWAERVNKRLALDKDFFEEPEAEEENTPLENAENTAAAECAAEKDALSPGETESREEVEAVKEKKETVWPAVGGFFRRLGHGLWRLCRNAAWLVWNLFLLLCALPFAGIGLLALVCMGALVALLIQGYPLVGAALCCLGGAACCVGILGLGSGLVWHQTRFAAESDGRSLAEETAEGPEREGGMEDEE